MRGEVLCVSLERGLEPVVVERAVERVVLIVRWHGVMLGDVVVPTVDGTVSAETQREAIAGAMGERVSRERRGRSFLRAARGDVVVEPGPEPSVSVVICARAGAAGLERCVESVAALDVVVVDCLGTGVRDVCAGRGVRCVSEPGAGLGRARNRGVLEMNGDVVAFLEDDCVVDADWLDGVGKAFADSVVMAAFGYVGPLELETRGQWVAAVAEGLGGEVRQGVIDGVAGSRMAVGQRYPLVRRRAFERVGWFAEHLGPGTAVGGGLDLEFSRRLLRAGYRVALDPGRVVWRRHPRELPEVRRESAGRAAGAMAVALAGLAKGDLGAFRVADARRARRGRGPSEVRLARAAGALSAPWRLARALRQARRLPSPPMPAPARNAPAQEAKAIVLSDGSLSLSVAIASYNRRERLLEVLGALGAQSYPAERYEVVVVLDGSTDGSADAICALEVPYRLRVVEQENRGLAASRNRGGAEAGAPVVVFLDDDIVPEPAFLAEHADAHRDGGTDHVALGTCPPARSEGELITLALRNWWEDYYRRRGEPDHPWTYVDFGDGNVSIPRDLLLRTGGWDEDFTRGGARRQDWEYGIRLLQAGVHFTHRAQARGLHHFDARLPTALRNRRSEGHSDVLLGRKHPHVRGHLNLSRFVRTPRERRLSRRFFGFTYNYPAASERVVRSTLPLASVLERAQLRDGWWSLVGKLLSHAYLLGVRDALPTRDAFQEFVAPIEDGRAVTRVPVALERPGRLEIPPGAGAVALDLSYRGRTLGEVQAIEPEEQLDWDRLTQRVVDEVAGPFDDVLAVADGAPGR